MDEEQNQLPQEGDIQPIVDLGSSLIRTEQEIGRASCRERV